MIFIPFNVPSKKNSRNVTTKISKTGSRYAGIINNKSYKDYYTKSSGFWIGFKSHFKTLLIGRPKPYCIGLHFIKSTHHNFDFIGPTETIQDLMVEFNWVDDDNINNLICIPLIINNNFFHVKKESGVIISLIDYDLPQIQVDTFPSLESAIGVLQTPILKTL